jgi:hypothetical protein
MGAKLEQEWKKTMKHIKAICELLESSDEYRALVALRALITKKEELEKYVQQVVDLVGADNIGNAITKIKAKSYGRLGLSELPEQLQRIPQLWLEGRAETRKTKGVLKMTFYQAERQHRRLLPYLEDCWRIAEQKDTETAEMLKEQILHCYEENSADDMTKYCYAFVHNYDLEEDGEVREESTEEPSLAELTRILSEVRFDYGVVSKEQVTGEQF